MSSGTGGPHLGDPRDPGNRATPGGSIERATLRWRGVTAFALLAGALGVLLSRPSLLLAGAAGVLFGGAARAAGPPTAAVAVEREVARERADPDESVRVTVTVANVGDALLPDVRVVDGVPGALTVAEGTPRHATALRPGKRATFSYEVRASRGRHRFTPATVLLRGFSGAVEREVAVPADPPGTTARDDPAAADIEVADDSDDAADTGADDDTDGDGNPAANTGTLVCVPRLDEGGSVPLRPQTTGFSGRVTTDLGGSGAEFHSVREYRPGDPLSRVDWARVARTGEFATRQFREERAATVVCLLDTRESAYQAPAPGAPTALERSVAAAGTAFTALLDAGDRAGIAAWGPTPCWLGPGTGSEHRARARDLLGTHPAFDPMPPDGTFLPSIARRRVERRLPADAQVLLFSPLVDDRLVDLARRLDAYGHRVTVVSPDPTAGDTAGRTLAAIERDRRLSTLRGAGLRVVDWGAEPLAAALVRADRRWSA
ncbi:DUF58 domain-containing protein [Haloglomus litoreum]|uniref:DUF58 domain-containing protein n=1 Tax=Haloglomus litoreum TaxID=3034026 RepID=UPI0023E8712E|nr:DUF58 domain-containing protein [Haloglomus sp. DT116]